MSAKLIKVNATNGRYDKGSQKVKVQLGEKNDEIIEITFYKFFLESSYIHNKYIYSEAYKIIDNEIHDFISANHINPKSFREFINLIENGQGYISSDNLNDIKLLCDHFETSSMKHGLENFQENESQKEGVVKVCGVDDYGQLIDPPNNKENGKAWVYPPMEAHIDPKSLLSYSLSYNHSVQVTSHGSIIASGWNDDGRIYGSLIKGTIRQPSEFYILDNSGKRLSAVSALSLKSYTLYMVSKNDGNGKQLVLCHENGQNIIDINCKEPAGLFGGDSLASIISSDGEIIFMKLYEIEKGKPSIASSRLPGGEKAVSIASSFGPMIALSSSGNVYEASIFYNNCELNFKMVPELAGLKFVNISGTHNHCFAVCKDGRVFVRGLNNCGCLGLGKEIREMTQFVEITSLNGYKIINAYAGNYHSLFQTSEGKILACGSNGCGELFLRTGPSENVFLPVETSITSGATFCVIEWLLSAVFIGVEPPPNTPNKRICLHD